MNFIQRIGDSLTNLVSRLGTERDKASSSVYVLNNLDDAQLLTAYRSAWLPRKIVDIPAFDSVRAWRDWQAEAKQIEAIEAEEKRLGVAAKVLQARIRARLWGGSAILIGTGEPNPSEPLEVERVGKAGIDYLTVLSRRHLTAGEIDRDPASEWYLRPKAYQLQTQDAGQLDIHPSRLAIFAGNQQPDEDDGQFRGWGDPILLSVFDAIKQADATAANIASLIFEAKVDIIRIPNFMSSLSDERYRAKLVERATLAATAKGINGTLMLDKEEEYESKSANFSTLPDVLDRFLQIVSGAADIPATRLLGQAPSGMNSTGESDLRNYYDRLRAMQELEMGPAMSRLDECVIRSALGSRPKEVHYRWRSLWEMSEQDKAEVFSKKANAVKTLKDAGLIVEEALADATTNMLVEDGFLPGLEAAIDEYGTIAEQEEPTAEELLGAAAPRVPTADAAPRTLYVRRDVLNADEIIEWAKGQGFATTLPADDLHVTITFSRTAVDWMKMGQPWGKEDGSLTIQPGGVRMMERFGDATVLLFVSSELAYRHEEMVRSGASWDHPEYQPHVTITYGAGDIDLNSIEPYRGRIVLGPEIFEEVKADWKAKVSEE